MIADRNTWIQTRQIKEKHPIGTKVRLKNLCEKDLTFFSHLLKEEGVVSGYEQGFFTLVLVDFDSVKSSLGFDSEELLHI